MLHRRPARREEARPNFTAAFVHGLRAAAEAVYDDLARVLRELWLWLEKIVKASA